MRRKAIFSTSLLAFMFLFMFLFVKSCNREYPHLETVSNLNFEKYEGKWFEVARLPVSHEDRCIYPVILHYKLQKDETFDVELACVDKHGNMLVSNGLIKQESEESKSKMKITFVPHLLQFMPFAWAEYYVVYVTEDYQYAIVGNQSRDHVWILSRKGHGYEEDMVKELVGKCKEAGFETDELIFPIEQMKELGVFEKKSISEYVSNAANSIANNVSAANSTKVADAANIATVVP